MLSKLFSLGGLVEKEQMLGDISKLDKRMSGATTGQALEIIGKLMQLDEPYSVSLKGTAKPEHPYADVLLFELVEQMVYTLKLKHFFFNKRDKLTIKYDIWY